MPRCSISGMNRPLRFVICSLVAALALLATPISRADVDAAFESLDAGDPRIRRFAAWSIELDRDALTPEQVQRAAAGLSDSDPIVRRHLCRAVGAEAAKARRRTGRSKRSSCAFPGSIGRTISKRSACPCTRWRLSSTNPI